MSIIYNKIFDPFHILWLDVRNILSCYEYQTRDFTDNIEYECSKEDYEKFLNILNKDKDTLKDYLSVDSVEIDNTYNTYYIYVSRHNTSTKITCSLQGSKTGVINSYCFVISEHIERKKPLNSVFNFSSKKTDAENEYMYGPLFEVKNNKPYSDKIGKYSVKSQDKIKTHNYRTELLQLNDGINSIINEYIPFDLYNELGHEGIIWKHDTLIVNSFKDAYNIVHSLDSKLKYTILYWSEDKNILENLYGNTGYTYLVMNNSRTPPKIMSRYKELVKSGVKPILPDDKTWKEQTFKNGPYKNMCHTDDELYIKDIEDPYFVQAVYEASLEDRMHPGSCLVVQRVHNNYEYKIDQNDYTEFLKIKKKYTK